MANTAQIINIAELFQRHFGQRPYVIGEAGQLSDNGGDLYKINDTVTNAEREFTNRGSLIKETVKGIPVYLPVRFYDNGGLIMHLPYVVVSIRSKKIITSTPMVERKGAVLEQYSIENYSMAIKGFLIADDKTFPEELMAKMRTIYEDKSSVVVDNALFNIFLDDQTLPPDEQRRVVILDYDFPEVTGGKHVRPFVLNLVSDTIFNLELEA